MNLRRLKLRYAISLREMPVFAGAIKKARNLGKPVDSSDPSSYVLRPTSVRHWDLD